MSQQEQYDRLFETLDLLCEGETDRIALMATIVCELYSAFELFDWVGFYRNIGDETLKIGPYQGGHGCLTIDFARGICGRCAREKVVQNIPDVAAESDHIACSATTKSEIVLPILDADGELIAVLDIDSNSPSAFDEIDESNLQRISEYFRGSLA
ncbi:MAG: GAF domain-containing protein [Phycisphaerae bacterium]|mgnify:CR=1 FL=1|jgi:GAF domain-containing protein|nr:GAF domain-containing protein [Phycisphaerae bacterium]MDP7290071.1 GAF domain-containing protein [Phycisphaerae bacterium]